MGTSTSSITSIKSDEISFSKKVNGTLSNVNEEIILKTVEADPKSSICCEWIQRSNGFYQCMVKCALLN